jgi:LysR family transcriptional regulator, pca operon transcriptional activator
MIDRRIKFRHIQCLIEICREKSLKRAAEKMFLTQPAISKTLKELEEILGAALLTRNRAGVSLTREGEVFLHFAEMSLASLQQGMAGVEQIGTQGKTKLKIGALPSVAASIMPTVASEFSEIAPNTELQIVAGSHSNLIDQLRVGALDLVIGRLGRPDIMQGISFTQLYEEKVVFVVRPEHPLLTDPVLVKIGSWQVIYPPKDAAIYPLVERFLIAHGIGELPDRLETVSGAFARVYVRETDAVWIISAGVVANELRQGQLVELPFDTHLTRGPVGLMRRPQDIFSSNEQYFQIALDRSIKILESFDESH